MRDIKICIFFNKDKPSYSESFIENHIKMLDATVINVNRYIHFPDEKVSVPTKKDIAYKVKALINRVGLLRLKWRLRKERFTHALAEYGFVGALVYNTCEKVKLPLTIHFHGSDAYIKSVIAKHDYAYRQMFKSAQAVVGVSNDMVNQLKLFSEENGKIKFNSYGIDVKVFKESNPEKASETLLAIGRFTPKKAPYLTILAFKKVLIEIPNAKLIIVGNGELLDICIRIILAEKLNESISIKENTPNSEIAILMQKVRGFVQHSIIPDSGDSEGTPLAILEASASGLPVISTRHAGIKDAVIHGKTGFLVEECDIESMSKYMIRILKNKNLAKELGKNGRVHISKNYELNKSIDKLKKIVTQQV